jgi:hypothetical protein
MTIIHNSKWSVGFELLNSLAILAGYTAIQRFMKTILPYHVTILALLVSFTTRSVNSCKKEKETAQATIQVSNNPTEGYVNSYVDYAHANHNGVIQLSIVSWTHGGAPEYARAYLKFDLSNVPKNATLISAKLSLFAIPAPGTGNFVDAHFGPRNSFTIRRITSDLMMSQITWANQPATTTQNEVIVPQSTSSQQNNIDIDVTSLVKDMLVNGNNGFFMQLQDEDLYNCRQYCSSFHPDAAKHPKLALEFKK